MTDIIKTDTDFIFGKDNNTEENFWGYMKWLDFCDYLWTLERTRFLPFNLY